MSKFSQSTTGGELSKLQELAHAQLPTGTPQPEAPAAAPAPVAEGNALERMQRMGGSATEIDPELGEAVDAGIQQGLEVQASQDAETQRQKVPNLKERAAGLAPSPDWKIKMPSSDNSALPDGGLRSRASSLSQNAASGAIAPGLQLRGEARSAREEGATPEQVGQVAGEAKPGSLQAAILKSGGAKWNGKSADVDPNYYYVGSAVTEGTIANLAFGEDIDGEGEAFSQDEGDLNFEYDTPTAQIPQAQGNGALGKKIHQEYQRLNNPEATPSSLPTEEAETLGSAFKQMWAENNPDLIKIVPYGDRQNAYQLTTDGEAALRGGSTFRSQLFPGRYVRPAKEKPVHGKLAGDTGANVVKGVLGKTGKPKFSKPIEDAMYNLSQVPHVVNKQRSKIMMSTLLPALLSGDPESWYSEVWNIGTGRMNTLLAKQAAWEQKAQDAQAKNLPIPTAFDVKDVYESIVGDMANEVRAVAMERKGANYLTYSVMGFNGRIQPQQTHFNPTTNKIVRSVTTNAVPAKVTKGGSREKALRQMYAMMLVEGADSLLPDGREQALKRDSNELYQWGRKLKGMLMSDEEHEAVNVAIEQGVSLDDPSFPKFAAFELNPETDQKLMDRIKKKSKDLEAATFIDGLIDYFDYRNAVDGGRDYHSFFNAYIDGKTNGIASNGMQMGDETAALATGVLRDNNTQLLDEPGDIRKRLSVDAIDALESNIDGDTEGATSEFISVGRHLFSDTALNKATTMTFGYGKDISNFKDDMKKTMLNLQQSGEITDADMLPLLDKFGSMDKLAEAYLNIYGPALIGVMSSKAIKSRELLRSSAGLHAALNEKMSIKGPTGMDINLGGDQTIGADASTYTDYTVAGKGHKAYHYETESTAAAPKTYNKEGAVEVVPGEKAYGGSIPGPVQAIDAATVALTASGKSWEKLQGASSGKPYMHTIYDAFKMDAAGYNTILGEVNKNWVDSTMDWSYLEEVKKSTAAAFDRFNDKHKGRPEGDQLTANERAFMDFILDSNGFARKMANYDERFKDKKFMKSKFADLSAKMVAVGYDPEKPANFLQMKTFVRSFSQMLNLNTRMTGMIDRTNADKKALRSKISSKGPVYQYYAH